METTEFKERKEFIEELKRQWKLMWWERIDDRVKAEGVARQDFSLLFVERGTVIMATRDYKPLDFVQVLMQHNLVHAESAVSPTVNAGGYGKFAREVYGKKRNFSPNRRVLEKPLKPSGPLKKGGRGWLHMKP